MLRDFKTHHPADIIKDFFIIMVSGKFTPYVITRIFFSERIKPVEDMESSCTIKVSAMFSLHSEKRKSVISATTWMCLNDNELVWVSSY